MNPFQVGDRVCTVEDANRVGVVVWHDSQAKNQKEWSVHFETGTAEARTDRGVFRNDEIKRKHGKVDIPRPEKETDE
jgi:hypothetical protein